MVSSETRTARDWLIPAVVCTGAVVAAATIGRLTQGTDVSGVYAALPRPDWAPPSWLFGPVWAVLYASIAIAGARIWYVAGGWTQAGVALWLWSAQLAVNALWPGVFFGLGVLGWAALVIITLDLLVIATIVAFHRIDRFAAWLLTPYLAWILFATALNLSIWSAA